MTSVKKAILLVGGKGTRLAPLTNNTPKPMLKVAGRPVTEHQIVKAREAGITELVLATSYLAEVFEPYFGDGSRFGLSIKYAVEEVALGTGGAIANAATVLNLRADESAVVFNGDVLSGHSLHKQIQMHQDKDADVTLYLTKVADPRAYGCVPFDSSNRVTDFLEKMENPITDTINAGCYIFSANSINRIPQNTVVSVERETFPQLLSEGANIYGYLDTSYWIDMGTPQSFIRASRDLVLNPQLSAATQGVMNEALIGQGVVIDPSAKIGGGSSIEEGCRIGAGVVLWGSVVERNVIIEDGAQVHDSFIAENQKISANQMVSNQLIG